MPHSLMRRLPLVGIAMALGIAGAASPRSLEIARADEPSATSQPAAGKLPQPAERTIDFARDIRTLFAKHCFSCHGPESEESGLRLDARERALAGGDYGPAIVKGKSDKSP